MRRVERGPVRARTGAAAVETAVVLLFVMTLFLGVFDFGRLLMARHLATAAAREGARMAVTGTYTKTREEIQASVIERLAGHFEGTPVVRVYLSDVNGNEIGNWNEAGFGQRIAVDVSANLRTFAPALVFLPSLAPVHARSIARSEGD